MQGAVSDMAPPVRPYPDDVPVDVCLLFENIALDLIGRGFDRYSSDAILHKIRWDMRVERGNREYEINDHWSAPLARWFIKRNPAAGKFFVLRERRAEA